MAFLDNSGDIILDAVLTDTGRMRLARGDGSFRITKFALGDDEINYSLYDKNNLSGSAYFDLNVLQTPIFEAFSNNIASLNSRLLSISRTNLLYLPVLKINNIVNSNNFFNVNGLVENGYVLAVDSTTETFFDTDGSTLTVGATTSTITGNGKRGILKGANPASGGETIRIDQGIDSPQAPPANDIDPDLKETQYLIEVDNRLMVITNNQGIVQPPSFIDDDDMATYYISYGVDTSLVEDNPKGASLTGQVLSGARGTKLNFKLKASLETQTSDFLFNQIGTNITSQISPAVGNMRKIITTVRITGLTTGSSIDVPVVLVKKIS